MQLTHVNLNSILLVLNGLGIFGNGGLMYYGQNRQVKKVEITQQLQAVASGMVVMQQQQINRQEEKIIKLEIKEEEKDVEMAALREYILRDSVWHTQIIAEVARLSGNVGPPPMLPPKQRTPNEDS